MGACSGGGKESGDDSETSCRCHYSTMSSSAERHVANDPAAAAGELALAAQVAHSPEQLALAAHSIATTPQEKAELEVGD